jgi:tetraprenyl-beta-curcumene synthase
MVGALARYTATIVPRARAEISRWQPRAQRIPDPSLRDLALATLGEEHLNAEAAAVFALLAPRGARREVVELLVAWQLMFDYLDTITERDGDEPLRSSLALHRALVESLERPGARDARVGARGAGGAGGRRARAEQAARVTPPRDAEDDGGYLAELVATCRRRLWALPAAAAIVPAAEREARRCGEAQSHTHAAMLGGELGALRRWAREDRPGLGLQWWESAAAGISSLAVHALLAAAAVPGTTARDAERIARAYTDICALSTLLDSLVDVDADSRTGNLSYFSQYPSPAAAAGGMRRLAARSAAGVARLPLSRVHRVIVSGLAGFYVSDEGARSNAATLAASDAVLTQLAPAVRPALVLLRARRALAS